MQLRDLVGTPRRADESQQDAAAILNVATLLVALSSLFGLIAHALSGAVADHGTFIGGAVLTMCVSSGVLLRRGRLRAGVLVSARAAVVTCALSVPACIALVAAEAAGAVQHSNNMTPAYRALTATLALTVTTAVFLVALRRLQRAVDDARAKGASL